MNDTYEDDIADLRTAARRQRNLDQALARHPDPRDPDYPVDDVYEEPGPESIAVNWLPGSAEWEPRAYDEYGDEVEGLDMLTRPSMFDYQELPQLLVELRKEFPDADVSAGETFTMEDKQ